MKTKYTLVLLLLFQLSYGQNIHEFSTGFNYPNSFDKGQLARNIGFEAGYRYSRYVYNNLSLCSGFIACIYNQLSWEEYTTFDFYIPINLGYTINDFTFKAGASFNTAQFLTFTKYPPIDPESGIITRSPYDDLNSKRTFGFGLEINIDYQLTDRFLIFTGYRTICLKDKYQDDLKNLYGLTTIGLKYRLNNSKESI